MAKLWDKYLVQRRDGTVPEWPYLVMGASDPAVPHALDAYAAAARTYGMDPEYCDDILRLADRFRAWRQQHWDGDPDAPAHRPDDPDVVRQIPPRASQP